MITGKEDLLQALIEAFLMEKGTHDFYAVASAKTVSPEARKTFSELSDWEERHMEYIQFLYQSVQDDRDIKGFKDFGDKTGGQVVEGGIPIKDLEAKIAQEKFADDQGALKIALEIEGKAYNLYRKMSEGAADSSARVVFMEMMDQEKKHIDFLNEERKKFA